MFLCGESKLYIVQENGEGVERKVYKFLRKETKEIKVCEICLGECEQEREILFQTVQTSIDDDGSNKNSGYQRGHR